MTRAHRTHVVVAFRWLVAPLVDGWQGLSLTRLVACFCCLVVAQDTIIRGHVNDWVDFAILALAVATAFGKMTYTAFLQRLTIGVAGIQTKTEQTIDATIRTVQERRGNGEFEPTP